MEAFALLRGGRDPTIFFGGHECINKLHHFCHADFESSQESIIGTVESMFMCCLTCLLKARCINVPSRTDIFRETEKYNCTPEIRLASLISIHKIR